MSCEKLNLIFYLSLFHLKEYVVLHEMHHAMGGLHEQQRNRRKYFVKINWENIDSNNNDQYALNAHTKNNEVYDYASILQYHLTVDHFSLTVDAHKSKLHGLFR